MKVIQCIKREPIKARSPISSAFAFLTCFFVLRFAMLSTLAGDFDSFFPDVLDALYSNLDGELDLAKSHFLKVMTLLSYTNVQVAKYNIPNGKRARGRLCVAAFKSFSTQCTDDSLLKVVNLVGWGIEVVSLL